MKVIKLAAIVFFSFFLLSCSKDEVSFQDTKNNFVLTKGKWVVINYWAGWCESCIKEIPELNQFYKSIQDKNILFYGVNYDNLEIADLEKAIEKVGIKFPVLTKNPSEEWGFQSIDYIPMTFIMNPEGKVVKKIIGVNTKVSLMNEIKKLQANENK